MSNDRDDNSMQRCGIVVIGRNEGARLGRSLPVAVGSGYPVVYVDSRSSDDSVAVALECGAAVVELDATVRLSAARARNTGADEMLRLHPSVEYLQFIDGDCLLAAGWVDRAIETLDADQTLVAVCGYRSEAEPTRNLFHRIAEIEWHLGGVGETEGFGGDVMIRADAFRAVGGYNPVVVAGEDPELSSRLRQAGGRIVRIDMVSTVHDIAMDRIGQWWKRAERGGYGGALVAHLHRRGDRLYSAETVRALLWGGVGPLLALGALRWTRIPLLSLVGKYLLSSVRAGRSAPGRDLSLLDRAAWGFSCALAAIPGAIGAVRYLVEALRGAHPQLIEYK